MFRSPINIFIWKHWKCIRYQWIVNTFNIVLPILLTYGQIHFFNKAVSSQQTAIFSTIPKNELHYTYPGNHHDLLLFAPNTSFNHRLMEHVRRDKLEIIEERLIPFGSVAECEDYLRHSKNNRDFAVIFDEGIDDAYTRHKNLAYTIRTRNNHFRTDQTHMNDIFMATISDTDEYINSGFLSLQYAIDDVFIEMTSEKSNFEIEFQKFPSNARMSSFFNGITIPGCILIFLYIFSLISMVLVPMVEEKQIGIKEFLRIASVSSYLNNATRFILHLLIGMFIFGVLLAIAASYGLTNHFSIFCIIILFILFLVSVIAFTFMVSVLFNSVFMAKTAAILCYLLPWSILLSKRTACLAPLFDLILVYQGMDLLDEYGKRGLKFTMASLLEVRTEYGHSMMFIYLMLLLDTFIYLILYYYFVQVYPGRYGTPRPFYFPFQSSYYCRNKVSAPSIEPLENGEAEAPLKEGIVVKVRGLTKEFRSLFGKSNVAVKNLSMDIYKHQITVLLGHNGAGKTTTMSMISGIIPKTAGTIAVDGDENIDNYRHKIGYCPQHNIFMPYFTCLDHLIFFGGLRGLSKDVGRQQAMGLLKKLHLTDKANEYGKNLSGGMKRRLCLGNALIGETQIAILDEPSSGLDPESRRELWNILLALRKEQSILITTHYMEEAEKLADKISIMSNGEVLCHGTSMQLKKRYAIGYVLKLLTTDGFNYTQLMELIHEDIPEATVKSFVIPTLNITLPYKYMDCFPTVLKRLEDKSGEIGIKSISMTNASLEEVFLNCDTHKLVPSGDDVNCDEVDSSSYAHLAPEFIDPQKNFRIQWQQIIAIFYKKFIFMREHWFYYLISCAFVIGAVVLSMWMINKQMDSLNSADWNGLALTMPPAKPEILLRIDDPHNDQMEVFETTLKSVVAEYNGTIRYLPDNNIIDNLLAIEAEDINHYHERIVCALHLYSESDHIQVKVLFSGNWLHSSAISLNMVENTILRMQNSDQYTIETHNKPIKRDKDILTGVDFDVYSLIVPLAIFLYILFYVYMPYSEEHSEFKKLQAISPRLYWITYFVFDALFHVCFCCILFAVHFVCDKHKVFGMPEYTILTTIYLFYGLAYLPIIYLVCQIFIELSSLYTFFTYMFLISNLTSQFFSANEENMKEYSTWLMFFLISPDYALRHALNAMFLIFTQAEISKARNLSGHGQDSRAEFITDTNSYVGRSDVLDLKRFYIYMGCVLFFVMLFLVMVWEDIYRKQKLISILSFYKKCKKKKPAKEDLVRPTNQVYEERDLTDSIVKEDHMNNYAIIASNIVKNYEDIQAVRGVSFSVKRGECFGLLGMNGAGKTTIFKMMTRDLTITKGDIYFNGVNSLKNPTQYKFMFGYCPQNDALNEFMTAYETIKYMAMIRGTPMKNIHAEVEKLLRNTDLDAYAHTQVKFYSGGTKRKLNTAIAMQSDPWLVFLDEPTTGVDPTSRRFMWACIQECQKHNKNIVLTSHSMDECEHLCNRLAIMTSGQLKCIGPIQELKNIFNLGFLITIMLHPNKGVEKRNQVMLLMTSSFNCNLREEYGNQLSYVVNEAELKWSTVFSKVQAIQQKFRDVIEDMSICESSLEDIFLDIARDCNGVRVTNVQDSPV